MRRIGYWDGTAGVAAALREAVSLRTGQGETTRLRDDPFPRLLGLKDEG